MEVSHSCASSMIHSMHVQHTTTFHTNIISFDESETELWHLWGNGKWCRAQWIVIARLPVFCKCDSSRSSISNEARVNQRLFRHLCVCVCVPVSISTCRCRALPMSNIYDSFAERLHANCSRCCFFVIATWNVEISCKNMLTMRFRRAEHCRRIISRFISLPLLL